MKEKPIGLNVNGKYFTRFRMDVTSLSIEERKVVQDSFFKDGFSWSSPSPKTEYNFLNAWVDGGKNSSMGLFYFGDEYGCLSYSYSRQTFEGFKYLPVINVNIKASYECTFNCETVGELKPKIFGIPDHCDKIIWNGIYYSLPLKESVSIEDYNKLLEAFNVLSKSIADSMSSVLELKGRIGK